MAITINGNGTVTGVSVGGLPDGIVDTDMLANNAVTVAKAAGSVQGITEMDQWRLTTNYDVVGGASTDITSNWERSDTAFSKIGTGMTESSGIFTFPSTGIWQIDFTGYTTDTDHNRFTGIMVKYSSNGGSSYSELSYNLDSIHDSGSDTVYGSYRSQGMLDVTNASDFRVKFTIQAHSNSVLGGNTTYTRTGATFIRLGDT